MYYHDATFDYCNVTMTYSHNGKDDKFLLKFWLPTAEKFQNHRVLTGGFRFAINVEETLPGGVGYGAATGRTDGGFGYFDTNFDDVFPLANGTSILDALYMFSYQAHHEMSSIGKIFTKNSCSLTDSNKPYAYYQGCFEGGREGFSQVQRFPKEWDATVIALTSGTSTSLRCRMPRRSMTLLGKWEIDTTSLGGKWVGHGLELLDEAFLQPPPPPPPPPPSSSSSVRFPEFVCSTLYGNESFAEGTSSLNDCYRLFLVPGASHCSNSDLQPNGPFPQTSFGSLIDWVEKKDKPTTPNATILSVEYKGEQQQLYAWPLRPLWKNNGTTTHNVFEKASYNTWIYDLDAFEIPVY